MITAIDVRDAYFLEAGFWDLVDFGDIFFLADETDLVFVVFLAAFFVASDFFMAVFLVAAFLVGAFFAVVLLGIGFLAVVFFC